MNMTNDHNSINKGWPKALFVISCLMASGAMAEVVEKSGSQYVRTDNYTLVSIDTKPEQINPLLSITTINFSQNIFTIGQAINELLRGSGYTWLSAQNDNDALGELELPNVVREIGPVRLRDALITVAGVAWELEVNEVNRTLWFKPAKGVNSK
jgi:conjugative transfer region protein (TIGR03748 family)